MEESIPYSETRSRRPCLRVSRQGQYINLASRLIDCISARCCFRNVVHIMEDSTRPKPNPNNHESKSYIGFVIGCLTVIILVLTSAIVLIVLRHRKSKGALTSLPADGEEMTDNEKVSPLFSNGSYKLDSLIYTTKSPSHNKSFPTKPPTDLILFK